MIGDLVAALAEGLAAPRRSMRRVLALDGVGTDVIAALVLGGYLVQALTMRLFGVDSSERGGVLAEHVLGLLIEGMVFAVLVALVWRVGRLFGGRASVEQCAVGIGWFGFVTAFLSPLMLFGLAASGEGGALAAGTVLLLAAVVITLWVFAGMVAELHGFRSTGAVLATTLMVGVAVTLLVGPLMPAP